MSTAVTDAPQSTTAAEAHPDHPPYVTLWFILLGLLGLSILCGTIQIPILMNVLVFAVAVVKAVLILRYYMHLKFEPRWVTLILVGAFCCLVILFMLVMPDVVLRDGWNHP